MTLALNHFTLKANIRACNNITEQTGNKTSNSTKHNLTAESEVLEDVGKEI